MLGKQPTNSINLLVPSRCSLLPCAYVYWNLLVFPLPYSVKTGQRRRLGSFPRRQLLPLCLYHFVGSHLDCSGGTEFSPLPSLRFQVPPHCFLVLSRGAVSLSYLCPCCFLCLACSLVNICRCKVYTAHRAPVKAAFSRAYPMPKSCPFCSL